MALRPIYRITVFVPPAALDALVAGIVACDDLAMGDYSEAMWISSAVREQYRPGAAANPVHGVRGELAVAESVRLEFSIPRDPARLARLLREGVYPHHPWEAPAVFVDESWRPEVE